MLDKGATYRIVAIHPLFFGPILSIVALCLVTLLARARGETSADLTDGPSAPR
jgi:hypothetical protein